MLVGFMLKLSWIERNDFIFMFPCACGHDNVEHYAAYDGDDDTNDNDNADDHHDGENVATVTICMCAFIFLSLYIYI